ncbi:MAG: VanZ family protein [Acidobacteriota bacterium]
MRPPVNRDPIQTGSHAADLTKLAALFLALYVCGIYYLSLYPFDFVKHSGTPPFWWIQIEGRRMVFDFLVNILFYVPLGASALVALGGRWKAFPASVFIGAVVSASIEYAQFWLPSRYSNLDDLAANALGTCAGAFLVALLFRSKLGTRLRATVDTKHWRLAPVPGLFLFLWVLWKAFPLFPNFNLPRLLHVFSDPLANWNWLTFTDACFGFAILALLFGPARWLAFAYALLPAQVFLLDHQFSLAAILGATLGCGVGYFLRYSAVGRGLAVGGLVWLVVEELQPFRFMDHRTMIQWRPFATLLERNATGTYATVFGKLFMYTAVVWMLRRRVPPTHGNPKRGQRLGWTISIGCPMLVLALCEWSQQWIEGRVPETTDLFLLAIGSAMLAAAGQFSKPQRAQA